uniref:Golgin subfamily A member 2 n=2 Tax=Ascaris TaxID=6251 RepID=F1KU05_ASCSU
MDTKAEKLAQARKKLREFQSKHQREREDNSSPSPTVSIATDTNGRRSANSLHSGIGFTHDEKSPFERVRTVSQSSRSSTTTPANTVLTIEDDEDGLHFNRKMSGVQQAARLDPQNETNTADYVVEQNGFERSFATKEGYNQMTEAFNELLMEKNRLASQLAELHGHYSEIYTAYSKLSESVQSGGMNSAACIQLSHLQTAMSVLVKERTSLQHRLREMALTNEQCNQKIHSIQLELNEKSTRLLKVEAELNSSKREIESLNALVQREAEELDKNRREAASWQAKVLHIQQDSNDAQERLKLCMRESEAAQAELQEARKLLHMKEIYLRQLGAYHAGPAFSECDIQTLQMVLTGENERLQGEVSRLQMEREELKQEANAAREHYETYGAQLNQNIVQISARLEEVSNDRLLLQSRVHSLEDELEVIRAEVRKRDERRGSTEKENLFETIQLRKELSEMVEKMAETEKHGAEMRSLLVEKDSHISRITEELQNMESELSTKVSMLAKAEESLVRAHREAKERAQFNEDVRSLSEQLQNEKATVSRAVAQNRELKDQLIELQDKLVVLSQESMERESGRLTALHTIEQLQTELERLRWHQMENAVEATDDSSNSQTIEDKHLNEGRNNEKVSTESSTLIDQRDAAVAQAEEARIRAERELTHITMQLKQIRADHRRVTQENEELRRIMEQNAEDENQNSIHVELGQAVERINALSSENERLRERIQELEECAVEADASEANRIETATEAASVHGQHQITNIQPHVETVEMNGNVVSADNSVDGAHSNLHSHMPGIAEKPLAWTELEARFARAMSQNADLIEQNERLEHVILQLQSENDTIGEYVTIYHHQRRLIRERMRQKEEAVARLSHEKEQMQQKLSELQETLMNLLTKKGVLRTYDQDKVRRKKKDVSGLIAKRANKLRSFSHSTVDEFSGDEETVVDGAHQILPENAVEATSCASSTASEAAEPLSDVETGNFQENKENMSNIETDADEDLSVQRIFNLITELQDANQGRLLPPCDPKMHCRECRGKLITL